MGFLPIDLGIPVFSNNKFVEALQKTTTARIGIGRAGERYPTAAQLKFREDLACARDSVRREVPEKLVKKLRLLSLSSRAPDRETYLMNLAAGRFLDKKSEKLLKKTPGIDVQIITSDGLSSEAFENNVPQMLPLLTEKLTKAKLKLGKILFVRRSRVALMDHVGQILKPKASIILLGERPGLGISDSLSGYFEYAPCFKRVESDRNVLSNIHSKGIPPTEAALMLAEALIKIIQLKKSGMTVRFDFA